MTVKNYYEVLKISADATDEEIRAAYYRLARQVHPDLGEGGDAAKFDEITAAYRFLSDPLKRGALDAELRRNGAIPADAPPLPSRSEGAPERTAEQSPADPAAEEYLRLLEDQIDSYENLLTSFSLPYVAGRQAFSPASVAATLRINREKRAAKNPKNRK